jgi:hypothetical protein
MVDALPVGGAFAGAFDALSVGGAFAGAFDALPVGGAFAGAFDALSVGGAFAGAFDALLVGGAFAVDALSVAGAFAVAAFPVGGAFAVDAVPVGGAFAFGTSRAFAINALVFGERLSVVLGGVVDVAVVGFFVGVVIGIVQFCLLRFTTLLVGASCNKMLLNPANIFKVFYGRFLRKLKDHAYRKPFPRMFRKTSFQTTLQNITVYLKT